MACVPTVTMALFEQTGGEFFVSNASQSSTAGACPVCGSGNRLYCTKEKGGVAWHVYECKACHHGYVGNRPTLEQLADLYAHEKDHFEHGGESIQETRNDPTAGYFARTVERLIQTRGHILDIGSGGGAFSYHLAQRGWKPVMIDFDPRAARFAAEIPGAEFHQGGFEDFTPKAPFDAIIMSQVLEHALHPEVWIRRAYDILVPGGILAIALPNFKGVYRVLGERDPFIIPPIHLNYYTPASLRLSLEKAGFRIEQMGTSSRIRGSSPTNRSLKRRVIGSGWNLICAPVLGVTTWGIILQAFARKPADAAVTAR
jgi:SAM-dependent methyltransferase